MSDIVLVYPRTGMDLAGSIAPPHNLLCVAAPLLKAGYSVKIIDQRVDPDWDAHLDSVFLTHPVFIGISAMTGTQIKYALQIAERVRKNNEREHWSIPIVWGGAHPTLLPEQVLATGLADYVCKGEVDETIVQIARDIEHKKAKSIINSPLPDVESLLPEPYELLDIEKYIHPDIYVKHSPRTMDCGQTSRGCPYSCVVEGTPINTPNHSCKKVEGVYDKPTEIIGYENGEVTNNQILYGESSTAEEVIEITVADGRILAVTPNHPIYTKRGWVNAGDLTEEDEVLTIASPDMLNREFKQCKRCGSYKLMSKTSKYCSRDCHDKSQIKERETKICPTCGKPFNTHNTKMLHQIYCGQSCSTIAKNKERDMSYMVENLKNPLILQKIKESKMGDKNPMKRQEVVQKMIATSEANGCYVEAAQRLTQLWAEGKIPQGVLSEEGKAKLSERMKSNNPMYNKELAQRNGRHHAYRYQNDEAYRNNILESRSRHPNKMEQQLTEIIERNSLPFKFTGDFSYWVGKCKSGKCRNPDYVDTGHQKKVILANGFYHHKNPILNQVELDDYTDKGYKTLVIWEDEITLANEVALVSKIRGYYEN